MAIPSDLIVETGLSPSLSAAADRYLFSRPGGGGGHRTGTRPILRIYTLDRSSLLLGRYQPLPNAFPRNKSAEKIGRRLTGGRAVPAGHGFIGIAFFLPSAWDLTGNPNRILSPDRVLNRYVRGVMRGCHRFKVRALYMGRDVLTVNHKKIALAGFTFSKAGGVLFECHLALSGNLGELDPSFDWAPNRESILSSLLTPPVTSVKAEAGRDISPREMAESICEGSESRLGLVFEERTWTTREREEIRRLQREEIENGGWIEEREPRPSETSRAESEIHLGRISVALALDKDGSIASATLAGDFLSDDRTVSELETAFCGEACEWTTLDALTKRVLNRPGRFILGLGNLRVVPDTLVEAGMRTDS